LDGLGLPEKGKANTVPARRTFEKQRNQGMLSSIEGSDKNQKKEINSMRPGWAEIIAHPPLPVDTTQCLLKKPCPRPVSSANRHLPALIFSDIRLCRRLSAISNQLSA
jgi:hypothetical protein